MNARLTKSQTDRVIDGVCGGLAEYFGIDAVIVRLVFLVLALINGVGILLYIILMIIMPRAEQAGLAPEATIRENVEDMGERLREVGEDVRAAWSEGRWHAHPQRAMWLGAILIVLGLAFLLDNLRLFWWLDLDVLWPLVLVFLGAWLVITRLGGRK